MSASSSSASPMFQHRVDWSIPPPRSEELRAKPAFLDLHAATWVAEDRYEIRADARRFENWEMYYAGKIGLGVAIDYAMDWGLPTIWTRVRKLAEQLRSQLVALGS